MEPILILVIVVLFFCLNGFKYNKLSYLSCGQWGYIGDDYNPAKLGALGLYNQSRGVHSCGMYVDGNIIKGINDQKLWMDFVVANPLPTTLETDNKVFLGHARQASSGYGVHGWDQQHPFHVGNMIGQQNGTINNDWDLARKYEIPKAEWSVDTELLYRIMDKTGFGVLEEYKGYAALLWTYEDSPNELWLFKGASPHVVKDENYYVERPLYYLREDNGVYFSSMENSLKFIRTNPEHEIASVPHNKIIKVYFDDEGSVKWQTVQKINRDLKKVVSVPYNYQANRGATVAKTDTPAGNLLGVGVRTDNTSKNSRVLNSTNTGGTDEDGTKLIKNAQINIFKNRCIVQEHAIGKGLTFRNGRYICDDKFVNGAIRVNADGIVIKKPKLLTEDQGTVYYFFAGVRFKNKTDWGLFSRTPWRKSDRSLKKSKHYFKRYAFQPFKEPGWVIEMSRWAVYPLKVMSYNCSEKEFEEKWYYQGAPADEMIVTPIFCENTYYFSDGGVYGKIAKKGEAEEVVEVVNVVDWFDIDSDGAIDTSCITCEMQDVHMRQVTPKEVVKLNKVWDIRCKDVKEFLNAMSISDIVVLHYYIETLHRDKDAPSNEIPIEEVKSLFFTYLDTCIKNKSTIRQEVESTEISNFETMAELVHMSEARSKNAEIFENVRAAYYLESANAFMDQNVVKQIEDVDAEEEDEDESFSSELEAQFEEEGILVDAAEEVVACCQTMNGVKQDLEHFVNRPAFNTLRTIVKDNNSSLIESMKSWISDNVPRDESARLLKNI